jgi:adenylate cyclase
MGIWNKIRKKENLISNEEKSDTMYAIPISDKKNSSISNQLSTNLSPEDPNVNFDSKKTSKDKAKFSIQFKLMVVISSVLAITTSAIITLATYFFKTDNKVRILETNLELVRVVELKVRADLNAVVDKGKQLALTLKQDFKFQQQREFFLEQFFKNDSNFIYLGVYKLKDDKIIQVESLYNNVYLGKVSLEKKDINDVIERNQIEFKKSFSGLSTLINASQGFQEPIICISIPPLEDDDDKTNDVILVIMIKLEIILDAFKKSGITETFMVSGDGTVIAHHDPKLLLGGKNLIESPIVRGMLSSQTTNGQQSFEGDDGRRYLGSFQKLKYRFSNIGIISTIPEDKAFEAVYEIQERNIYIMIISLCASLVVIVIFAKSLSSPILSLLDETVKISKGMFKLNIQRTTNDEVGILTDYFITMAKGLEEREKVKSILGSMIDPVVVQEAMNDLVALKRGSEKTITAFFSDVAGFSNISEQLKSVDLASLLNEYLSAMTLILQKHNGVLDKYIGDAIVGIFGAPVDVPNHSIKACHASLQMINKLSDLREYWIKNNLYSKEAQEMDVRIGLNTGPAKVGFMGTDNMGSFTMMGDTVNLAARLEAAGKDYGVNILISEMIKDNIQNEFFIRELDLVRVKGKNEPVKLYELISISSEIPANLKESTEIYQDAFKNYLKRDFSNAIVLLNESIKARGKKDKSAKMLIERCETYLKEPPSESWDGVYTRTHK